MTTINAYTIIGDSVFVEDEDANLLVTPHTAHSPIGKKYLQEFEACNKRDVNTTMYLAFVFEDQLKFENKLPVDQI